MPCSAAECLCAKNSTCSCGAKPALQCNCSKAATENVTPSPETACVCGKRLKDKCTCGNKTENCEAAREGEVDFTDLK